MAGVGPGGTVRLAPNTAFADAIAIYLLSLCLDVDYYELREREYPLLAPSALAERLKKVAALFPPNAGFQFSIIHRRRPNRIIVWRRMSTWVT